MSNSLSVYLQFNGAARQSGHSIVPALLDAKPPLPGSRGTLPPTLLCNQDSAVSMAHKRRLALAPRYLRNLSSASQICCSAGRLFLAYILQTTCRNVYGGCPSILGDAGRAKRRGPCFLCSAHLSLLTIMPEIHESGATLSE
jgi:hypothetical protein